MAEQNAHKAEMEKIAIDRLRKAQREFNGALNAVHELGFFVDVDRHDVRAVNVELSLPLVQVRVERRERII